MPLSYEEQERRAYMSGRLDEAALLRLVIDASLEDYEEICALEEHIEALTEELVLMDDRLRAAGVSYTP